MRRYTHLPQHDNDVLNMLFLKRVMVYAGTRAREYNSTVGGSAPKTVYSGLQVLRISIFLVLGSSSGRTPHSVLRISGVLLGADILTGTGSLLLALARSLLLQMTQTHDFQAM